LYDFDPKSSSRAFATPRSWSFVSELLEDDDTDDNTLTDLVAGAVGEGLAILIVLYFVFRSFFNWSYTVSLFCFLVYVNNFSDVYKTQDFYLGLILYPYLHMSLLYKHIQFVPLSFLYS
jgi:hypothetical protein